MNSSVKGKRSLQAPDGAGPAQRLMIVSPTAGLFGGTERVLEILLSQVEPDFGFSIAFLSDGPLVQLARDRKLACQLIQRGRFSNPVDTLRVVRSLRRWIRNSSSNAVLAWTDMAQLYAGPASWGLCKSLWWQRTNVDPGMVSRLCRWIPSAGAIANSEFTRDQLRAAGVRVADQPLYPPFEAAKFTGLADRVSLRKQLDLPADRYIVGSVGRMQSWKGFDTIVDAIAQLRKTRPQVMGLIVGGIHDLEPDYEASLRARISRLGLDEHVILSGPQRNVADWMGAMDVFVHAAEREPFGIVVPEAMALGLAVIASIPGGPAEAIEPEVCGLLVNSGNVTELISAINKFIDSRPFAATLGASARQASVRFSDQKFIKRLFDAVTASIDAKDKR